MKIQINNEVRDATPEEIAAFEQDALEEAPKRRAAVEWHIRSGRNAMLAASDWVDLPTSQLADAKKQAWATYRQALRDVSAQPGFPFEVVWPIKPE
jgi:hypothetical protein